MKVILCLSLLVLFVSAQATFILEGLGPERAFLIHFVEGNAYGSSGMLYVRVRSIEDSAFFDALKIGATKRSVKVLVDGPNEALLKLAATAPKNLDIRWIAPGGEGRFRGKKLESSFAMSVAKGSYISWSGAPVWRKGAFQQKAELMIEGGGIYWEESPRDAKAFLKDFDLASRLR